ncbi:hypothetical protein JB92DRAFT_3121331 [Gautieria morchelliformis]|nr:hypothetical protein JB92DRAFT_3121331 [Gautieria morchelliformis]
MSPSPAASPSTPDTPIAVVGVSAEFPSGHQDHNLDYASFWPFLLDRREAFSPIPSDRFNLEAFSHLITPKSGAFLSQPTLFDPLEFGIPPADAAALPLATRKLVEHAFLALRDAGINYRGAKVGVYTAGVGHDASVLGEADPHSLPATFAGIPATIANRISYHLDLHGPSLPVDTACSSSLIATHLAVQALRSGDCESAIVGGAQVNLRINEWIQYSQSGVLAKDGKCKPFDASADGFARGEGVACIVLKPLENAMRDGDHVYGTILGSAINAAGNQAPLNAPVAAAQQAAMTCAYKRAGREPIEADFVEMHATGALCPMFSTAAGDPTEANWVGEQFKKPDDAPVLAGSVKGNLGHLEITAFLASLLKVTHMVANNVVPPTANFSVPNRKIHWNEYNLHVPATAPVPFSPRSPSGKALVSLSSFGIGGANGHVVLEGPVRQSPGGFTQYEHRAYPTDAFLIMAGGLSPRSAGVMADLLRDAVTSASPDTVPFLAKLAGRQARQLTWRSYAIYYPHSKIPRAVTFCEAQLAPRMRPSLAFVFSGQGPQHVLMGRQLFAKYAAFRQSVFECDDAYRSVMGCSLIETSGLFAEPSTSDGPRSSTRSSEWTVTLPALTIFQIALFDLLGSFGVKPDVVLGHSAGETALLYASGAAPKQMAVEVAVARAKMMSVAESVGGGMAAVACGELEAQAMIDKVLAKEGILEDVKREQSLVLACYNSPDGVSVAGVVALVDKLCVLAESRGILARRLKIPVPVHSYLMDVCKYQCESHVGEVFSRFPQAGKPTTTMYSTVTGGKWEQPFSVDYYWRNARQPVLFHQVTEQLVNHFPSMCYVEISPHPVLSSYVSSAGVDSSRITCPSRRPAKTGELLEGAAFLQSLGRLATNGYDVDFDALNGSPTWDPNVKLPAYPFSKKHVPFHADTPAFHRLLLSHNGPLNHPRLRINSKTHPLLAGHVVNSEPIMPAAGFIEMALEFGARTLTDVEFLAALPLSADVPATVEVGLDGTRWHVKTSSSLSHGTHMSWAHKGPVFDRIHSQGLLSFDVESTDDAPLNLTGIQERCMRPCRIEDLYEHGFKGFADYSADFKRITSCVQGQDEVLATLRGPVDLPESGSYRFDPVILDAVFHGCMFFIMEHEQVILDFEKRDYFLPSRAARVELHDALAVATLPEEIAAHFVLKNWTPGGISVDIFIVDNGGARLCTIRGFEMTRHSKSISTPVKKRYQLEWQPVSIPLHPAEEVHTIRELTRNTRALWTTLDALAIETIKKTLAESVVVGVERHRQRYWDYAQDVAKKLTDQDALAPNRITALRAAHPSYFDVTERVAKVHRDIFTSSTATVQALYSKVNIMQDFYGPQNTVIPSCEASASIFRKLLTDLVGCGKKVIRVLEVGCGTGMLTQHLVNVLPEFPDLIVEYVATDISLGLAMQAAQRFSHPYMRAAAYDLTKTLETQGIAPGSFDVVSALHVLHATADLSQTMNSISDLLVPGGYVLTVDFDGEAWQTGVPGTLWYDFVFGGFQEWFDFGEDRTTHCTISLDHWGRLLNGSGFNCVTFSCSDPEEDHSLVFLAQKANADHRILPPTANGHPPLYSNGTTCYGSDSFTPKDLSFLQIAKEPPVHTSEPMFTYSLGQEMRLRDQLAALDAADPLSVWIVASEGRDGDAARGLTRTLGKELPAWKIHLVVCESSWTDEQRRSALANLQGLATVEPEIKLDVKGSIYVPRVVPLSSPPLCLPFESDKHWAKDGSSIVHGTLPVLDIYDIAVDVSYWSSLDVNFPRAFIGAITDKGTSAYAAGDWVMGITNAKVSNRLVVHAEFVVPCQSRHRDVLSDVPGLATAVLALGPGALRRPGRLAAIRHVLVCDAHTPVGHAAARLYTGLGLDVFCVADGDVVALSKSLQIPVDRVSVGSNALWVARQRCLYDVVLSGAQTKPNVQVVERLTTPQGTLYLWSDEQRGLAHTLKHDPWAVALALEAALQALPEDFTSVAPSVPIADAASVSPGTLVPTVAPLFDARKTYLLIGGIGGLGVQMALWMYENGARDIVLTSRRGRGSLRNTNQTASLRTVEYMEWLPDLSLSLEAVDASDYEATARLVQSLQRPIGGCFLMSLVLSDKSFANQTSDDFRKVFAAKTVAFGNLARATDISAFDFFVSFSSVAALFGSAGQSNYTSASSSLEGMTSKLPNAFSLVVPGITDSGWLPSPEVGNVDTRHVFPPARLPIAYFLPELCDCLADGIIKLRQDRFEQYIPALNWNLVREDMGMLPSFQHLCVAERNEALGTEDSADNLDLAALVCGALNIGREDFSSAVPFTAYGLDSLVAVRLAAAIRGHTGLKVTQMQLLADMTLDELERRTEGSPLSPIFSPTESAYSF